MLVAPLNWGLGHATRCIPVIHALIKVGYEPVLASDGNALLLLQKEFPLLKSYVLPSYNIRYAKKKENFRFKILLQFPSIILTEKKEKKIVTKIIEKENIKGVISDNRFGVVSKKVPSVYITHQLNVLSGLTTFISSKIHQRTIQKFDECWVPDFEGTSNFSGKLGHLKKKSSKIKYIGILSRFQPKKLDKKYDLLVLLSGPEPQRTLLETTLLRELKHYKNPILFVRGVITEKNSIKAPANFTVVNYLLANELEEAINQSAIIISRSGYTTLMDLAVLGKKAFFIPTPGQFEQEYLAELLSDKLIAPYTTQQNFTINSLDVLNKSSGFKACKTVIDLELFKIFEGE